MSGQPIITAGIDVGNQTVKVAVLRGQEVLSWSVVVKGVDTAQAIAQAMKTATTKAGLDGKGIASVVATGAGRKLVGFAQGSYTDIYCAGTGATWLYPGIRTIVDMGAEECRVIKCNDAGKVTDFFKNDKCAAGVGMFIETMAKALGVGLEQAGTVSLQSTKALDLSTSCVIFAESEVVTLVNRGEKVADVLRAVHMAAAFKTASLLRRLWTGGDVALIGGVAKNEGYVDCLRHQLGTRILIPENPEIAAALGAALLAQNSRGV